MPVPPSPALRESLNAGDTGHIADHEAIADALNNDTASLTADNVFGGDADFLSDLNGRGLHQNTDSPTYGPWFTFGNAPNSMGFAGTPPGDEDAFAPLVMYYKFGESTPNADIEHTTQGGAVIASYYGPTIDDSAEAFSFGVFLKDTGTPFTQTKALTGGEAISQIEGGNHHAGSFTLPMLGFGSRINVLDTSIVDHAEGFRASVTVDAGATLSEYVAFGQPQASGAASAFGIRVADPIVGFTSIVIDDQTATNGLFKADLAGSGGGSSAFVYIQPPTSPDLVGMRIQQAVGSVKDLFEAWLDGASTPVVTVSRLGFVAARNTAFSVNDSSGNGLVRIGTAGLEYLATSLQQSTVGAAGGASALPATPSGYFKAKNQAGTVVVIPYYAAT